MDHRKRIPPGSLLPFPGMVCHVEDTIGAGSNAIVYQGWYTDHFSPGEKHHVLIKELYALEQTALDRMAPANRQIYLLSHYADKTNEEIAQTLSMSYRAVESRLYRSRQDVR